MTYQIKGQTYYLKEKIKAKGGKWNAAEKCWEVDDEETYKALQEMVNDKQGYVTKPSYSKPERSNSGWTPCGYPGCKPGICDECEGKGGRHHKY